MRDSARASPLAKSARQHVATWSQAAALRRGRRAAGLWACDRGASSPTKFSQLFNRSKEARDGASPDRARSSLTRLTPANALYRVGAPLGFQEAALPFARGFKEARRRGAGGNRGILHFLQPGSFRMMSSVGLF